jgi:hypothetical protein
MLSLSAEQIAMLITRKRKKNIKYEVVCEEKEKGDGVFSCFLSMKLKRK